MKMIFLGRTCLIVLSLLPAVSTQDAWRVVGSDQPVIAEPGDDVILPCHISSRISAVDMEVRWYRDRFDTPVHLYLNKKDQLGRQDIPYRGRTALPPSALQTGDISLHLRNLQPADTGVYTCYADNHDEEGLTELIVTALGTQPSISMDSTQGEQTRLVCRSEGWYPEPEVIWRDRDGNNVTSLSSPTLLSDSRGLLSVSSYIKIKQQSNVFSCLVRSKIPKPDWESKLHISSDFFPGVSGWMVAFFLTLALSIGAIPPLVIQWRRMDAMERKLEPKAAKCLRKELESVKREVLKSEWKWILSSAVDVTLDPDTAHPRLILSAEGKRVRWGKTRQSLPDNPERFDRRSCVLGKESFTSGRRYWQVQVGWNRDWRLGVSRESAKKKGWFSRTPQQGYWTVWWDEDQDEFTAVADPEILLPLSLKPQKLGVYLDYEEKRLSFYNVETRSHIYTFTDMEFNPNEKLYPFFWTEDKNTALVLKSCEKILDWESILAASVGVTLDPDTAHPLLILSAEGKQVRKQVTLQDLPHNPERFNYKPCVLGRESFTSGRRYWQVQVGGNTSWILGVSRESAERKGRINMTPQQGYWTVGWSGGWFTALSDHWAPLPRNLKPQKLGVYLDYEEGQLSFYNVETRSHIYTFTDMEFNPNEKLYPLFYTGDNDTALVLESPDPDPVSAAD
ncbi:butyrophilin subfamily 1 member A1-like [Acipenser ruthenus]|uniref:butyrophilin subfamily 1 member A1-like n=1 Tax=Acipenser ruthenus TaxID=7906 RepID=UPI002740C5BC|nr:butyrophilin subfamily 1 member A1-like [Acipenser ruthenus]XP_058874464.1 butyrophilin subfamily 1 member A1-like [Acipenser ruthenus]XP_058874465.1 butyrophilin subfamily 1 member A1-like [Acipenser ruthenus]XP_058874466.1 butyrophilin subfamily 1 member A1-like [Acipenser ruthenus]XP_058874467.1 butyrophilin subfamily 1 member A1-like [Acipenser ruthenus]XP_058874468.1 butyrophilin subfamily 1 member A1-like [Acipenser ruthenus]XP_058874469.1 butyrophilin subfamily 1 member A1-like [Aci